jgi:hypothetical protein
MLFDVLAPNVPVERGCMAPSEKTIQSRGQLLLDPSLTRSCRKCLMIKVNFRPLVRQWICYPTVAFDVATLISHTSDGLQEDRKQVCVRRFTAYALGVLKLIDLGFVDSARGWAMAFRCYASHLTFMLGVG